MKYFYRVGSLSKEGLWYNKEGVHTGLIHSRYPWLKASSLIMPFENELVGYLSVADSLEHLYKWFSKSEILKLQENGLNVLEYIANDYKFYDFYEHNVINKESSIINNIIILK